MILSHSELRSMPTRDRARLDFHAELSLDELEGLELTTASPLIPIGWAGGLPIFAPGSGYNLAPECDQ